MQSMTKSQRASNVERLKLGWDEMHFVGWARAPHYDTKTNNLKWAVQLSSSSDNHATHWINESIRLLGRGGFMKVTLVTDNNSFSANSTAADTLLSQNFSYVPGERYAEFKRGDKIAQYGLAALVLGGAGAAAAKLGIFQKFWKLIVAGAVALVAFVARVWSNITGKAPPQN
jgi:uncharacterized membrane-anchored protein